MMRTKVLNWYARDKKLTRGLRKLLSKRKVTENYRSFVTIRHGSKWADKLNPGDTVAISISDDPQKPSIIGYAEVGSVKKVILFNLGSLDHSLKEDLKDNIGAKDWSEVLIDMRSVYGNHVGLYDTISIIRLVAPVEK